MDAIDLVLNVELSALPIRSVVLTTGSRQVQAVMT